VHLVSITVFIFLHRTILSSVQHKLVKVQHDIAAVRPMLCTQHVTVTALLQLHFSFKFRHLQHVEHHSRKVYDVVKNDFTHLSYSACYFLPKLTVCTLWIFKKWSVHFWSITLKYFDRYFVIILHCCKQEEIIYTCMKKMFT